MGDPETVAGTDVYTCVHTCVSPTEVKRKGRRDRFTELLDEGARNP